MNNADERFELFKEREKLIEDLQTQIPQVLKLLQEEIDKCDAQIKRWRGRFGFWRFLWDEIRGKTK